MKNVETRKTFDEICQIWVSGALDRCNKNPLGRGTSEIVALANKSQNKDRKNKFCFAGVENCAGVDNKRLGPIWDWSFVLVKVNQELSLVGGNEAVSWNPIYCAETSKRNSST